MSLHPHSNRCACCHEPDAVVRPSSLWKVALVGGYGLFGLMVFGASLLGPTIMVVIPFLAVTGLGLLPWLHDRAGAPAACRACGKIAVIESAPRVRSVGATTVARPA